MYRVEAENSGYAPVVVMVEREETSHTREWVEQSEYNSCEAHDVFEAIEEMADITMPFRPEVIVLDAECCETEAETVHHTLEEIHLSDATVPVLAVSETMHATAQGTYEVSAANLPNELENLIAHAADA